MAIENDMEFSIFPSDQIIIQTPVDSEMSPDSENPIQTKIVYAELEKKVDKEEGKQLSTEDYTTAEKGKLNDLPNLQELNDNFDKKVDKVVGKGLSANDYTNEEKTKLQNLPTRGDLDDSLSAIDNSTEKIANKTSVLNQFSTSKQYPTAKIVYNVTNDLKNSIDLLKSKTDSLEANKVTKETGKGLSSNDYTDSAKNKVDAIPNNPKYTDTVYDDTELRNTKADKATTLEGYGITNAYTKDEIDNKISNVYEIKGSSTIANLPTNPEVGDVYNIIDSGTITGTEIILSAGDNIVYTSEGWDKLSATIDLSSYATETEIERLKYYGDPDIVPSDESYFIVNETSEITGLTDTGKNQTELVIPYKINDKEIARIGNNAFYDCTSLKSIIIPNNVTSIGVGAFSACTSLTSIEIPNSVTSIGDYAFSGCTSLTSIEIPNNVTSIRVGAFAYCSSLTSINIPNIVTNIEDSAFRGCTNLTIYCEQDSYAGTYAKENNIPVIYTDVKADSLVNNILDDTGTGSIHQKFDGNSTFDFTGKNPNATSLDPTLTGNINKGATGNYASSFGGKSAAMGKRSHSEGTTTIAKGNYSHAEGDNSVSLGNDSHAEGYMTVSHGDQSHSEGIRTVSSGASSHAEGIETTSTGRYSHSEGIQTKSIGESSHSEGNLTEATGAYSHVEGHKSKTLTSMPDSSGGDSSDGSTDPNWNVDEHLGESSHAEGAENIVVGYASHAEGAANKAYGHYSHAEGILNITGLNTTNNQAIAPHAEGYKTEASGNYSHAEGSETKAQGIASHAEGSKNTTSGETSHAEGSNNIASGVDSHVEGSDNKASHKASHVEGQGNETSSNYQHIQGKYSNKYESSNYAHIVGNGENDTNRSNAYTLDWNGNGWFAGDIKVGGNQASEGSSVELKSNKITSTIDTDTFYTEDNYPSANAIQSMLALLQSSIADVRDSATAANQLALTSEQKENKITIIDDAPNENQYPTVQAVKDYAEPKTTVVNQIPIIDGPNGPDPITFNLGINNRETRYILNPVHKLTISFPNGEYATDYTEGLSFKSGTTPTHISYAATGIIQWIGTDCFIAGENKSIFKPSANTQYDIVFYYNGGNYIVGLVNGYKVTTGNQEASA